MNRRIIGFDFGLKRIGAATGSERTGTAQALDSISAKDGEPQWDSLDVVIREWQPELLLVGLPLTLEGAETSISSRAKVFATTLGKRFKLPVVLVDERLSSNEADHLITESAQKGKSRSRIRQKKRDSLAAELIIRTYLNDNRTPV